MALVKFLAKLPSTLTHKLVTICNGPLKPFTGFKECISVGPQ